MFCSFNCILSIEQTGIPERIEYIPGSGSRVLVPDAELQLCDLPCETENVTVKMLLATHHIGKGCDRDTYSIESQRKLCGNVCVLGFTGFANKLCSVCNTLRLQ